MADQLSEAQTRYREALDATREQRLQIEEDLKFSDPSDPQQWDDLEKRARETDPGGARPCLVMDQIGQYVSNVAGQVEQRPPGTHAIPASSEAQRKVAEQLDGFYRHIEHSSRASQHYARALTSAARAGVGYLIVRPEVIDRALNYQEPRISSEGDPLRVVFDPWSVELDGSDANFGHLLTPLSHTEFERQFGTKAAKVSFGDPGGTTVRDARESILVAEEWRIEDKTTNQIVVRMLNGDEVALAESDYWQAKQNGQPMEFLRTFKDKSRCVKWLRMSGAEILTEEREYPASGIGIVPVYGYVGWSEGRMRYCGIPRRAREAQRAYNYHISEIRALMATAPKTPWIADIRAVRGMEKLWERASVEQRAFLPFNGVDEAGQTIPMPVRAPVAVNLQNHISNAEQALKDIQASIGMYQANLGAPSNETSGVAIENRKAQGEASTAHFPSHLAAALGQVGKLCFDMIPRVIDTKRQLRVLGIDHTPGNITVDPKQPEAMVEPDGGGLSINPNIGRYDVRIVVGAAYSTQRQQAQEAFTEIMRAQPALVPAIAPLWAQTVDFPHADKLAQVLTAMAPDAVKAILQPDQQQENTATLKAQVMKLQQALQEAIQHARDAQADADEAQAQLQKTSMQAEDKDDEIAIKAFDARTKRLQAMGTVLKPEDVQTLVVQTINNMLSHPDPLPGELGPGPGDGDGGMPTPAPQPTPMPTGPAPTVTDSPEPMEPQDAVAE